MGFIMNVEIIPLNEANFPAHEELAGSPRGEITQDSLTIIRKLKCLWRHAPLLAMMLLGRVVRSGTSLRFYVGHKIQWTLLGGSEVYVCAEEVSIDPFGQTGQGIYPTRTTYIHALLTVVYRVCPTNHLEMLIDEMIRPSAEYLTQAPDGFSWTSNGSEILTVDEAPGRIIKMLEWDYEIKWFPLILVNQLTARNGQVNNATVTSAKYNMTFAPGTLLCLAPDVDPQPTMFVEGLGTVTQHFAYRPEGWNKFYKHGTKTPASIYASGAAVQVYSSVDLSGLFLTEI